MIIKNGLVFGEDRTFTEKDLFIENGMITDSLENVSDRTEMDAKGLYVIPGLVDVHSHGACGYDFSDGDADGVLKVLEYQRAHGITSYCPTSMTLPKEKLMKIFATAVEAEERASEDAAWLAGINMEGPFLDPAKKGAHVGKYIIDPDVEFFRECNEASGGRIRLVTLAPNTPGAIDFIRKIRQETVISLGHTSAAYPICREAIQAGADHVTHLYNAMPPFAHRDPGLVGAAAEDENCMVELISDGIHIHESMVRATFQLFPGRVVLVSDSMRAAGMADGTYELGGQQVTVAGKLATLEDGTIAGSVTNLYDGMKTAVRFGIPLEDAVAAATINAAKSIGIDDKVGSLVPGKKADILLVDKDLNLVKVI